MRATDTDDRVARVQAVLATRNSADSRSLVADMIQASRFTEGGTGDSQDRRWADEAEVVVKRCLAKHGMEPDDARVAAVRRAMALPVVDRMQPLPGSRELLAEIKALGLKCVIASNTYWRDATGYLADFTAMGMAQHIDAIITSVDAGHPKPNPAVFEMAMSRAGTGAARCVMIGNSERNDIAPAVALGMQTILVHPDDPAPASTKADAVAPDLWKCAEALRVMLGRR